MDKKIAGFVIIAIALISLGVWELWGRENIAYKEILVLNCDFTANMQIEEKHISIKKTDNPDSNVLRPKDKDEIIGMEASQFIAKDSPLRMEYFMESKFATAGESGKEILSVPKDWLLSVPQTLRRGDQITFYNDKVKLLVAVVAYAKDSSNQEVISDGEDRLRSSGVVEHIEIIGDTAGLVELSRLAGEGKKFTVLYG